DLLSQMELALDADGTFLALRGVHTSNVGAHAVSFIPLGKGIGVLPSLYHFSAGYVRGRAVLTNTAPTYPYRSAGRPEVMYVLELNTGAPRERAVITVRPDERIDVVIGTLSSGQGHETSFAQLIVEWFGVDLDRVSVITGDTELAPVGGGSHSGRSMRQAGVVMAAAGDQIIERGVQLAAWLLEASEVDIE